MDDKPRCMQDCQVQCQFPFFHNGVKYDTCTNAPDGGGDELGFSWCATKLNSDGNWTMRAECECVSQEDKIG